MMFDDQGLTLSSLLNERVLLFSFILCHSDSILSLVLIRVLSVMLLSIFSWGLTWSLLEIIFGSSVVHSIRFGILDLLFIFLRR